MPRIPINNEGELEFKFIPKSKEQPQAATKKTGVKRSDFEKFLKVTFWAIIAFLIVSHFINKSDNPSTVSQAEVRTSVVKAEVKPQDDPGAAWQGAYDKDGDGFVEAWEGIEDKKDEYYNNAMVK